MQHMDIWALNVMVAAHQENVARALRDSQRRSTVAIRLGSLLIWLGEWLARDSVNRTPVRMPRQHGGHRSPERPHEDEGQVGSKPGTNLTAFPDTMIAGT